LNLDNPIIDVLPPPGLVRDRLGDALREVELLRRLLQLSTRAEEYRTKARPVKDTVVAHAR
jgi:hypothetical protein